MSKRTTRREMLQDSVLMGIGVGIAVSGRAQAAPRSANEKLNIGIIGSQGRGGSNTRSVSSENIVALCDVDSARLEKAAQQHPKARKYEDWRKLVEQKDIDTVVVSTTDHTHAPACVWAMTRAMSGYCEKYIKGRDACAVNGQTVAEYHKPEAFLMVVSPDFKKRHVWTVFSGEASESASWGIAVRGKTAALIGEVYEGKMIVTGNAMRTEPARPFDGYLVVWQNHIGTADIDVLGQRLAPSVVYLPLIIRAPGS